MIDINKISSVYFLGIGGIGMSALARYFNEQGVKVSGYDKTETASRLRGRIASILDWATTSGYRQGDNPARWQGHLANLLPAKKKTQAVTHHAALPYVDVNDRIICKDLGEGFYRVKMRFGFLEETNVPATLDKVDLCGPKFDMMHTSFFLSRQTLIASKIPGMAIWREKLFAWMLRNAANAMEFFKLPSNRVVELGSQVEI